MSLENIQIDIDIEFFSDEQFDIELSVKESKQVFHEMKTRFINSEFDDDVWLIERTDYAKQHNKLDFSKLDFALFNGTLPDSFKLMVKCWIVQLVKKYKRQFITSFIYFVKAFEVTKGFRVEEKNSLMNYIEYSDLGAKTQRDIAVAVCNFFDFTELEISEVYVPSLVELLNKIPEVSNIRRLPPSKDILSFSYFLDLYFEELKDESVHNGDLENELYFIYPLVIWWRLSNIIPMRPTEFCHIKRNCVSPVNDKYYIKLPRRKTSNKRIQNLDTILIDYEMFNLISHYQDITDKFGKTDTLISYKSLAYSDLSRNRLSTKKNLDIFSIDILSGLIKRFYNVMEKKFDCIISKENYIRPNDTRHLAFVSLMMQGYSPIEIARLGGHSTISAQYHYSAHIEFWVDCEVFKLMTKSKQVTNSNLNLGTIPKEIKLKAYGVESEFKKKLKIGYCKDKDQRCESRKCYLCSHWGITPDEFIEKEETIKQIIFTRKNKITELVTMISNLNRQFINDELSRRDTGILTQLKTKANAAQHEINSLAKLCTILGEGVIINGDKIGRS
ncbi:site-specific integrase [Gottfriedia acidiceleris]|uniref:site-specific integrase n=1 Tax=Gottfriedia acidiceleris TaxID=371036 RepID=UPI00101BA29C|nr:site-specific integrase [Gottfriedia acidiceleris]